MITASLNRTVFDIHFKLHGHRPENKVIFISDSQKGGIYSAWVMVFMNGHPGEGSWKVSAWTRY